MLLFILSTFILATSGDSSLLSGLIERIHNERKIHTVYIVGNPSEATLKNLDFPKVLSAQIQGNFTDRIEYDKNVILLTDADHLTQTTTANFLKQIRTRRFVIIQSDDLYELERYFSWFWKNKFSRIFGITGNQTYAYLPFADCRLQRLNESSTIPDALRDLNGYGIRTSIQQHVPSVFRYKDKSGNHKIGGAAAQIFFGFIRKHNATFVNVPMNNSVQNYFRNLNHSLNSNELDMSMLLHSLGTGLLISYPVRLVRYEIVVPYNGYIAASEYFIRPFKLSIWLVNNLMLVYIGLIQIICDYYINRKIRVWKIYSQLICTSMGIPTERRLIGPYRLYLPIYVFFFILYNLYVSLLKSYLTVFIKSPQFDTFQDIIDNDVKIIADSIQRAYIRKNIDLLPGLESVFVYKNMTNLANGWYENSSVGFMSDSDRTGFFLSQQTNLKHPLFRVCKDFFTYVYVGFALQQHSPFYDACNRYVMEIWQSGLIAKWITDSFYQGREAGILKMLQDEHQTLQPLTLRHFGFSRNCLAIGLSLSLVVFIGELALKYFNRK